MSDLGARRPDPPSLGTWVSDEEVAAVLGGPPTELELLKHNPLNAVTGGIWRVTAGEQRGICKVVTDGSQADHSPEYWEASHEPRHFNYWRREVEAYADDLAARFRLDGVEAPRLLELGDRGSTVVLWLEDVEGTTAPSWDLVTYATFAADLGRAQGRLAAEGGWDRPWLSRDFLAAYAESKPVDEVVLGDPDRWQHPRVHRHLGDLEAPLRRLHDQRHRFYDLARACPRTLCHLDVWPANLARREADEMFTLFDWSFCGDGALGEDIANLIPDSVFDLLLPAELLDELAVIVEEAYLDGVAEGGWGGDDRWVRLGIRAAAVKYHWLVAPLLRDADRDEARAYGGVEVDIEALYDARATGLRLLCRWADEAESLATALGID